MRSVTGVDFVDLRLVEEVFAFFLSCEWVLLICFEFVGAILLCSVILLFFISVGRVDAVCVLAFLLGVLV